MREMRGFFAILMAMLVTAPSPSFAANHREAPITALDRPADITDWYAFVSYDDPSKVTMILSVDPLLDPGNGPNYFPFDPDIVYVMYVDNNHDAVPDVSFEFRFQTEIRAPGIFTGFIGAGNGINSPANAPRTADGKTPTGLLIPPAITALDGQGSEGFSLRQTYSVTMVRGYGENAVRTELGSSRNLFAVPTNVGSRTMPNYAALARQGIYNLGDGVRVFAGTTDDPFYIDLGGTFDSLNLRGKFPSGIAGVMTAQQDRSTANDAPDSVAGFNVNTIAVEVPIAMVVQGGQRVPATDPKATIGTWGATLRPRTTIRRSPTEMEGTPSEPNREYRQVQRMGNPLINEVIIGTGSKDKFSMSEPKDDAQFASFAVDPVLARALNAIYGIPVPNAPRVDLLPLVQYLPPIAAAGTPAGPVADMLRLNTGIGPTAADRRSRLGLLAGDAAGFPNGRRITDDVTDISLRAVAGVLAGAPFNVFPYTNIGDAVNSNDRATQETFPYMAWAHSGLEFKVDPPGMKNLGSPECVNDPNSCR